MQPMNEVLFETTLAEYVEEMLDACTRCGKCVEACPSVEPAGILGTKSEDIIGGILELVRTGNGPEASRKWAQSCMRSGACIKACDYGVNPRFLLSMARLGIAKSDNELAERRRRGVEKYRDGSRGVCVLSRLQLDMDVLERLGQKSASVSTPVEAADFVFYTGCNALKTPHIALLALDIMDALGVSYQVMGGPSHCCGILQLKSGDAEMAGRMGSSTMEKLSHSNSGQVISWCPSCYVQYTETILPTGERQCGSRPFEMNPFMRFLGDRLAQLKPHLQRRVEMRVALHKHPGVAGVVEAAAEILTTVPGIELVDLNQPAVGLQSVDVGVLPKFKRELQLMELEAARDAGVDALVAVYHSDHRELCAHERDWPFRIINILEVVGESMGLHRHDRYKELKIMQDADQIVDCSDLIAKHSLDPSHVRDVVVKVLPLALALGFLVGLERERVKIEQRKLVFAGVRTHPLISMLGFGCAWLYTIGVTTLLPAALGVLGVLAGIGYVAKTRQEHYGATSEVSALLTFVTGAMAFMVDIWGAMALGVLTLLLSEKAKLESYVEKLDRAEFLAILKFLFVSVIILPVLPDREYTTFLINPASVWKMGTVVVLGDSRRLAGLRLADGQPQVTKKKDVSAAVSLLAARAATVAAPLAPRLGAAESALRARFPVRAGDLCAAAPSGRAGLIGTTPAADSSSFRAYFSLTPGPLQPCGRPK